MKGRVEPLTSEDVPDSVALAAAVGWKDVASDWRVLHDAALVVGVRRRGRLIAQGALGLFGESGTIAKMIVAPDVQRQGLGATLLDGLLDEAARRDVRVLGLVATDPGQPLYEQRGFETVGEVVVLGGMPRTANRAPAAEPLLDVDAAVGLDARFLGCSRARMIVSRHREAAAESLLSEPGAEGYAMATTQGQQSLVGPVIASSEAAARELAGAVFRSLPGPVRIDVPADQGGFRRWLLDLGLAELGVRSEMARGAARLPWQVEQRFALAAQAWG